MKGSTGGRRHALLAVVAGGCLALSACAGASVGTAPGHGQVHSTAIPAATQKFCLETATALRSMDSESIGPAMTLAHAQKLVDKLMTNAIKSFTMLGAQAPSAIQPSIMGIVADFRAYKKSADTTTSIKELVASTVTANPVRKSPYQHLLSYAGSRC